MMTEPTPTEAEAKLLAVAEAYTKHLVESSDTKQTQRLAETVLFALIDKDHPFNNCDMLMGFSALIVSNIARMPREHHAPTAMAISMIIARMLEVGRGPAA